MNPTNRDALRAHLNTVPHELGPEIIGVLYVLADILDRSDTTQHVPAAAGYAAILDSLEEA